ncbi:MAG: thioredoxin family protein [Geopsychrobacter sp.]|nr:thioredoxin family protein [Geopsychrobacter sp.]
MRIDILCKPDSRGRCEGTLSNVRAALNKMGVEAEVHQFQDSRKLIDNRIYVGPALLIDDQVRIAGRVPDIEEIIEFLAERPRYMKEVSEAV